MTEERPLSIAFFTDTYKPTVNGVVTAVDLFATQLRSLGHRVYIFGPRHPRMKSEPDYIGLRSFPFPVAPDYRVGLPISLEALKQIPRIETDIVHCHTPGPLGITGWSYAKTKRNPLIHTYHSLITEYAHYYIPKYLYGLQRFVYWWEFLLYKRTDAITTPTPFIKEYLDELGLKSPITILPTGIDLEPIRQARVKDDRITQKGKKMICVARLAKEKNLEFIIETFAMVKQMRPDTILIMVGDGPHRPVLKRLVASLGLEDDVIFTGLVPRSEVAGYLNQADVFAYACRNDTQGLVVLEALAAGKPLFLIKEDVFKPFVEEGRNGYQLIEDEYLFAQRISEVLGDDQKLNDMSAASYALAEQYSIVGQTDKLVALYRQVLADRQKRRKR